MGLRGIGAHFSEEKRVGLKRNFSGNTGARDVVRKVFMQRAGTVNLEEKRAGFYTMAPVGLKHRVGFDSK